MRALRPDEVAVLRRLTDLAPEDAAPAPPVAGIGDEAPGAVGAGKDA